MRTRPFLITAGVVFGLASGFHLARLAFRWPLRVGTRDLPLGSSVTGFLGAASLAAWSTVLALRDEE